MRERERERERDPIRESRSVAKTSATLLKEIRLQVDFNAPINHYSGYSAVGSA